MYEVQWQRVGKLLYVAGAGEGGQLFVTRIDLTGQTPACLILPRVFARWATLAGFVVADEGSYVAVRDSGIVVLPHDVWNEQGTTRNAKILTQQHGLPSLLLTGMAGDRGRLWLAYGQSDAESGLGLYDPSTGRWETVLCSTLQGAEPFGAGRPYALMHLVMPSDDSLYFINYTRMFRDMQRWAGLWRLNTMTRTLKYYGGCENEESPWAHLDVIGKDCWFRGSMSLIRFDTQSEEAVYVLGREWRPAVRRAPRVFHWLDCRNDLFLPDASMGTVPFLGIQQPGALDLANCAIHGNDLWALLGEAQIAVLHRGKPFAEAQIIRNDILEGEAVRRFLSTPSGLVAIGDGVIGLVEMRNAPPAPSK
jgi:hypothetical protein